MKYLRYIVRHKLYVLGFCMRLGIPVRGLLHDLSKLLPSEWTPYNDYFYKGGRNEGALDLAWLLHQKRNPHHWQYWVLLKDDGSVVAQKMPLKYVKEMVADWCGAGIAITGRLEVWEWYEKNSEKMLLHSDTKRLVELLLERIKKAL